MRLAPLVAVALLAGCSTAEYEAVDLTQAVAAGQVRAGTVSDPSVLWGGISAEAQVGDALLVNDRARFVVQGARPGSFYFEQGGGVIDADIVRPAGVPGRDIVEEFRSVIATARVNDVQSAAVIDSGVGSDAARVVVSGTDLGMELLTGVLEAPDFLASMGLQVTTEYRLVPDSYFLEVRTVVTATEDVERADIGDVLITGSEVADRWRPGAGMNIDDNEPTDFLGAIAQHNDVAVVLATVGGEPLGEPLPLLSELGDVDLGVGPAQALAAGESFSYTRLYGVGPDLATLTDELLVRRGVTDVQSVGGVVTTAQGPVAGARVVILLDGEPWTIAVTGSDGSWAANAPADAEVSWRAVGRGTGYFTGLPGMTGHHSPFVHDAAAALWLEELAEPSVVGVDGYGLASEDDPLTLIEPARVTVSGEGSFEVLVTKLDGDPAVDRSLARPRPGPTALGWARGGVVELALEPGEYRLLTHRGVRFERDEQTIQVAAGEELTVNVALAAAYDHSGWLLGDPHQHASPSNDGDTSMEERLLVNAARGVQLPFGTDHDRLTDYNVLIEPLGLSDLLRSVVADEISSVRRGHVNAYPVVVDRTQPNNGAYLWYSDIPADTSDYIAKARQYYPGALLQMNHPLTSSGMARAANWSEGRIGDPDFWSDDLDVIEVLNAGDHQAESVLYMDLVKRGYPVAATGVSDAHGRTSGGIGFNTTFLYLQTDSVADYSDDALKAAIQGGRTIVSMGPFLDLSVLPGSTVDAGSTVDVAALFPSWMDVDQLELYQDGVLVELIEDTTATFTLASDRDATFVIMARGNEPMGIYNETPWAMAGAIYVDADGGGFESTFDPLQ